MLKLLQSATDSPEAMISFREQEIAFMRRTIGDLCVQRAELLVLGDYNEAEHLMHKLKDLYYEVEHYEMETVEMQRRANRLKIRSN